MAEEQNEDRGLVSRIGPITIDWPRTVGYYGAIAAAVAFDVIAPPLGIFIAVVPFVKFLKRKHATKIERAVGALFEGAAKPVGGDAESTVRPTWIDEQKVQNENEKAPNGKTSHNPGHTSKKRARKPEAADRHR
jgi:hypothetical protein